MQHRRHTFAATLAGGWHRQTTSSISQGGTALLTFSVEYESFGGAINSRTKNICALAPSLEKFTRVGVKTRVLWGERRADDLEPMNRFN